MTVPEPDDDKNQQSGIAAWLFAVGTTASLVPRRQIWFHVLPPAFIMGIILAIVSPDETETGWVDLAIWAGSMDSGSLYFIGDSWRGTSTKNS